MTRTPERGGDALLEEKPGHHELPDRAGRVHALDGPVLERVEWVVTQRYPVLLGQTADKHVVVVGRVRHQRQKPARLRFHDHDAARLIAEQRRELLLQLGIEAKLKVFPVLRFLNQRFPKRTPKDVDFDVVQPLVPAQTLLKHILKPLLAHRVAEGKVRIGGKLLLVGFRHVPENMREFLAFGIIALGPGDDFQPRPVHELRFNARDLIERHVVEQKDRLERLHLAPVLLKAVGKLLQRNARPLADLRQRGGNVLAVFPDQGQPEGGPVFGKQRALYVTDKAARSVYRLLPQVVGLRLLRKIGSTMDLEIPKPDDEREEQQADEALQQHKPALRRLIAFGFKLYCFHWGPPTGAPSCCIAKQTASAALGECFRRAAASCREE